MEIWVLSATKRLELCYNTHALIYENDEVISGQGDAIAKPFVETEACDCCVVGAWCGGVHMRFSSTDIDTVAAGDRLQR